MENQKIENQSSMDTTDQNSNILEVELTDSVKKNFKFIGIMHQIAGVIGFIVLFIYILFLFAFLIKLSRYEVSGIEIFITIAASIFFIAWFFMIFRYTFSSGSSFKYTALLGYDDLLKDALIKHAKYLKWTLSLMLFLVAIFILLFVKIILNRYYY